MRLAWLVGVCAMALALPALAQSEATVLSPAPRFGYFEPAAIADEARTALLARDYAGARRTIAPLVGSFTHASPDIFVIAAMADAGLGNLAGARAHFMSALQMDRADLAARAGLALTLAGLGDRNAAATQLRWLESRRERCAGTCAEAVSIDQAVTAASRAIGDIAGR